LTEYPTVGSRDVKHALARAGWESRPGRGHTVFSKGRRTVVVDDDVKRFSAKLLGLMRRQIGMDREGFIALLRGDESQ
jgi:hypothetical protein